MLKVLARKKDDMDGILMPRRMDTLTDEDALLSVSRGAATPTGGKLICDTSDNLDVIREVDNQAGDSALAPQVGAHGSYSSPCTY